jgi:hypothetical protein
MAGVWQTPVPDAANAPETPLEQEPAGAFWTTCGVDILRFQLVGVPLARRGREGEKRRSLKRNRLPVGPPQGSRFQQRKEG